MKKVKRQLTEWSEIFTNHIYDKGLVSGKDKELSKLNNKRTNHLKMGENF